MATGYGVRSSTWTDISGYLIEGQSDRGLQDVERNHGSGAKRLKGEN